MNTSDPVNASGHYSDKWKERFAFFEAHGGPSAPGFRPALKQLPFLKKVKINFNFFAFFFGPVYLFILGLWKKNLSFIAMIVVVSIVLDMVWKCLSSAKPRRRVLRWVLCLMRCMGN
ncbi:Uncharacterized protein AC514_0177 [Pseudomonas savastanoi pv. phaseolicola]|uniref:Uncharacterized protein n=2 Tax=Pseudomonas savastanoi TaxID=29438 RepID=A0A3M6E493_PSESG|nr:Uncharacterized protein AC514_0177 [Pseudomonas savastanoi pv. phaseolicola]KPB66629.1 Uncharacterized protein AC508_0166 [Pseudomonas amygdali pv. mellea]RMM63102.1 hypothetical protein ALQ74_03364 [Pseudomonas savastanoi pv. glycinea]KPB40366.1 Uncharacterized protein AC513_1747 [Pseudomonas savastanoi pv. phaseolicola]KPB67244.1 Uncharacterized protein AC512_5259 [Pseudomonas savastanoi pv. phaseolicola]